MHLIHCVENMHLGGCQSLLGHLHYALNKYHPDVKQDIIALEKGSSSQLLKFFNIKIQHVPYQKLNKHLVLHYKDPILVFHKLLLSNTHVLRNVTCKKCVINHTYAASSRNKIHHSDCIVSVTEHMRNTLKKFNPGKRIQKIHNGVNAELFEDFSAPERLYNVSFISGSIHALGTYKYNPQFMEWVSNVDLPKPLTYEIIGGGSNLSLAKDLVRQFNGTNKVKLIGSIAKQQTKIERLKSWDIFLYAPVRDEGLSVALLEAQACGVPCIINNKYGNIEIMKNGTNGYVCLSLDEFREIISELMKNPKELEALKKSTKEHFDKNLDAKHMAREYYNLFRSL